LFLQAVMLGGDGIVEVNEGTLELNGGVPYGAGRLVKRGAGTLQLSCNNNAFSHDGRVFVEAGVLTGCADSMHVVLNAGTMLAANTSAFTDVVAPAGSVIDLQGFGLQADTVTMAAGATLRPHVMAGSLPPTGPPVFAFFNGALYGAGTAQLNGATLDLVMPATNDTFFRPPNGSTFTIVSHAQGTFAGVAEGELLASSRGRLKLSYVGGDTHDAATLTFVDAAPAIDRIDNLTMFANFTRTLSFASRSRQGPAKVGWSSPTCTTPSSPEMSRSRPREPRGARRKA